MIIEGKGGKNYRPVEEADLDAFRKAAVMEVERPGELILPEINADDADDNISNSTGIRVHLYGMKTWGSLFNPRQLVAMQTFVGCVHEALEAMKGEITDEEYRKGLGIYLGLWMSRTSMFLSNVGLWKPSGEFIAAPFSRQAIPMVWDYPEVNIFADASGGVAGQLDWILRVIRHESFQETSASAFRGDGAAIPIASGIINYVITDPPYFDAIAYADLSDYFYVWLKRGLGDHVPEILTTPLTPKSDEATALNHRHNGDEQKANKHFQFKLAQALGESHRTLIPGGMISIMFAHQSTKAWTALIRAIFEAGLNISATWPIDTERERSGPWLSVPRHLRLPSPWPAAPVLPGAPRRSGMFAKRSSRPSRNPSSASGPMASGART